MEFKNQKLINFETQLKNKKVAVIGLGVSNIPLIDYLKANDADVTVFDDRCLKLTVKDRGIGIPDVKCAMQPLYTTDKSGERSGMGFCVMESFMDKVRVISKEGAGTTVTMYKSINGERYI